MSNTAIRKILVFTATFLVTVLAFQNCGDGFKADGDRAASDSYLPFDPQGNLGEEQIVISCASNNQAATLSQTCFGQTDLSQAGIKNFRSYIPQYPLYKDGAVTENWVYLPDGTQIDTSDLDNWVYPVGTVLWKSISLAGKKIETRKLEKVTSGEGPNSWTASSYLWLENQNDAELWAGSSFDETDNKYAINNIASYEVIRPNQCMECHQGSRDVALSFTFFQLSKVNADLGSFDIASVNDDDWLTNPPTFYDEIKGTPEDQEILGYLHANCSSCHSPLGVGNTSNMNLKHNSNSTSLADENAYATTVGVNGRIVAGTAGQSSVYTRMNNDSMPQIGVSQKDTAFLTKLNSWINGL